MLRMSLMTRELMKTSVVMALLLVAIPAAAQVPAPVLPGDDDADDRRPYSQFHAGFLSGAQRVDTTGVTGAGEFGVRLRRGLHLVVEGGWMSDITTASRRDEVDAFAAFVQSAYGVPTSGEIEGPTLFGLVGFRFIPDGKPVGESSGVRPYMSLSAGLARVEYIPTFTVDGQDVSGPGLVQFGVQLGRDLVGTTNRFAYSGAAGIVFGDTWYLDLGVRVTRIHTTDHPTTVSRLAIGLGRRF